MTTLPARRRHPGRSGAALVTTLMIVAILTLLVISMLSLSSQHRQSAELQSDTLGTRQLGDLTLNLVIARLRQATANPQRSTGSATWVSQPGAIRTWNGPDPDKLFKLYSAAEPIVDISSPATRSGLAQAELEQLQGFDPDRNDPASRARFADLNRPVITLDADGAEQLHFPIADPRAALGSDPVEGFSFDPDAIAGTRDDDDPRLPMPVEWLYLLQDGSLGTLDPDTLVFTGRDGTAATAANPIVARIAFWTDDESSKLNVNTASEPIPWDTPRADTTVDRAYATRQPSVNEVQRFPGHPATTALSPVLYPGSYAGAVVPSGANALASEQLRAIYDIAPRVSYTDANGNLAGYLGNNNRPVQFKTDRLYTSFDELLYRADRSRSGIPIERLRQSAFFLTVASRAPETNVHGFPRVSIWPVADNVDADSLDPTPYRTAYDELMAFASTIAVPEGRRYVESGSGWTGSFGLGAYHKIRGNVYQRAWSYYGRSGGNAAAIEYRPRRNYDLFEYQAAMTRLVPGGYRLSLDDKYGISEEFAGARQNRERNSRAAVKAMMGYIRTINLHDTTRISAASGAAGRVRPFSADSQSVGYVSTQLPTQPPNGPDSTSPTAEFEWFRTQTGGNVIRVGPQVISGRLYSCSEVALLLICVAERAANGQFRGDPTFNNALLPAGQRMIQLVFLPEWFSPQQGFNMLQYRFRADLLQVTGAIRHQNQTFTLATNQFHHQSLHTFAGSANPAANVHPERILWGGTGGPEAAFELSAGSPARGFYQLPQHAIAIPIDADQLELDEISMIFQPMDARTSGQSEQRIRSVWPATTVPAPRLDPDLGSDTGWVRRVSRYNQGAPLGSADTPGLGTSGGTGSLIRGDDTDVVRSVAVVHGDTRMVAAHMHVGHHGRTDIWYGSRSLLAPLPDHHDPDRFLVHTMTGSGGHTRRYPGTRLPNERGAARGLVPGVTYPDHLQPDLPRLPNEPGFRGPLPESYPYPIDPGLTRDWDNGIGPAPDGAYVNKPDDGARLGATPYFEPLVRDFGPAVSADDETFAPNRIVASAVTFGSLLSLPLSYAPWTTFLFRPDLTPGGHFGARGNTLTLRGVNGAPPDHLWLDLWWMPVVQPHAISEPMSTAGKVNLNHQILPFSHITRATALHGVLKSEELLAIPATAGPTYKTQTNSGWRHRIDAAETLRQWDQRFIQGNLFLTESEICELFLVPHGRTLAGMPQFWQNHALTGDNTLERPYANLYPRLTTRSNTYRVHYRVQTLRKARSTPVDTFDPDRDRIGGEYEGSALIERYLDPRDTAIPDYVYEIRQNNTAATATLEALPTLDAFHRFRILETRRFAP